MRVIMPVSIIEDDEICSLDDLSAAIEQARRVLEDNRRTITAVVVEDERGLRSNIKEVELLDVSGPDASSDVHFVLRIGERA